jgi:hypothetical protein
VSFLKHLLPIWKRNLEDKSKANAAFLHAIDKELTAIEKEAIESKVLLFLETAEGEWLDEYGKWFGVYRRDEEEDPVYRTRIISYVLLKRGTIPAILEAVRNFLNDYTSTIEIYEPHVNIFRLNHSRLNGPDRLMGHYYNFAIIDVQLHRSVPEGLVELIEDFKAAGVRAHVTQMDYMKVDPEFMVDPDHELDDTTEFDEDEDELLMDNYEWGIN